MSTTKKATLHRKAEALKQLAAVARDLRHREIALHATMVERERCAKIADEFADNPHATTPVRNTGDSIADRIRSGE